MWVAGAARPLTAKELALAVSIKPGCRSAKDLEIYSIETVIQACENLLTVEDNTVRFCHFSVFEYLTTTSESGWESGWGNDTRQLQKYQTLINDKNAELAEICVQYLLFEESRGFGREYWEYTDRVPFASYAAYFFDHHIQRTTCIPDFLAALIRKLLESPKQLLANLYTIRSGDYSPDVETIDPLHLCLMLGISDSYAKSQNPILLHKDSTQYRDALHLTARGGSVSAIQRMLDLGYSVDTKDGNNRFPLDHAAEVGRLEALNFLLKKGAKVNAQGGKYGNALQAATSRGNDAIVQSLLEAGADVNAQGGEYSNALQAAAYNGYEQIVQTLLEHGADVNALGGVYGNALQAAAYNDHFQIVQTLLEHGADVNAQGGEYGNALQAAAFWGHKMTVQILLKHGANVNARGRYDNAIQAAQECREDGIIQILKQLGAAESITTSV
jgi:ankyrin repeat protein